AVVLNRLEAIVRGHGWNRNEVLGNVHLLALAGTDLTSRRWQLHLSAMIERLDVGFVLLDPLAELAEGDEDSNTERRAVVKALRSLTMPTGAAVCLVHHLGKAVQGKSARDRIRGASAVRHASRCTYLV